ncbi:MAG: hypothetical protein SGI71_04900 [Verrucomicrobiota bacterium]|nr:hypothetical protein [Verrucomicrobiota bacterium]
MNTGEKPVRLEQASSFCLNYITPFETDDAPMQVKLHRFRSRLSGEGALESRFLESLDLERSWLGFNMCVERFGNAGTMTLNGWHPSLALEDIKHNVFWGARLGVTGSWQM